MTTYTVETENNGRHRHLTVVAETERDAIHAAMRAHGVPFSSVESCEEWGGSRTNPKRMRWRDDADQPTQGARHREGPRGLSGGAAQRTGADARVFLSRLHALKSLQEKVAECQATMDANEVAE